MWSVIFEQLSRVLAVILCAIAVKLIDDFLDRDLDMAAGSFNVANQIGSGVIIYGMLVLALAASLNAAISLPLFLASYSIGMFPGVTQLMLSGLKGWEECLVVFLVGVALWNWHSMFFSMLFIVSIQLFDDYLDLDTDQAAGYRNWAQRLGKVECLLLGIVTLSSAWQVDRELFLSAFGGTVLFYSILVYWQRRNSACYSS